MLTVGLTMRLYVKSPSTCIALCLQGMPVEDLVLQYHYSKLL